MTETLTLTATPLRIANEDTLAAMAVLTPANTARQDDLVALSQEFLLENQTDIPSQRDATLWSFHQGRFMPQRVANVAETLRARVGLAYALLVEDQSVMAPVITASRSRPDFDGSIHLRAAYVRGGVIVHDVRQDLALFEREGDEAQAHVDLTMQAFFAEGMSNHERVNAIASLSAAASDIATWGTVERHIGAADGAPPTHRKVKVIPRG